MAELPITSHNRQRAPGLDGHRWHVNIADTQQLVVEISESTQTQTGLSTGQLHEQLPAALQRWAEGRLRNDLPVLDQVAGWDSPIVLRPEHLEA